MRIEKSLHKQHPEDGPVHPKHATSRHVADECIVYEVMFWHGRGYLITT